MKSKKLSDTQIDQIIALYQDGDTIKAIALRFGVTVTTIVAWLKHRGVYDLYRGRLSLSAKAEIVHRYVDDKQASSSIAASFGVTPSSVARVLKQAGVTRTNSEAQSLRAEREGVGFDRFGKKGAFHSKKCMYWIPVDSAYEFARMEQLEHDNDVVSFSRCSFRVRYNHLGEDRTYVPDITVVLASGAIRVEEVKPEKYLIRGANSSKFEAASAYFLEQGIQFAVVTESDIGWRRIRELDSQPLGFVPPDEKRKKRNEAAAARLRAMSPEDRAIYNEKARLREAAKRSANREEYNRNAREYRQRRRLLEVQ